MVRRAPSCPGAQYALIDVAVGELRRVGAGTVGLQPGGVPNLTLHKMVTRQTLHVAPVFRMSMIGESDTDTREIHQGARLAGNNVAVSSDDLGQEAEARASRSYIPITRVDTAVEDGVTSGQGIV